MSVQRMLARLRLYDPVVILALAALSLLFYIFVLRSTPTIPDIQAPRKSAFVPEERVERPGMKPNPQEPTTESVAAEEDVQPNFEVVGEHRTDAPLIFIGGFPRSGTTLMRAILDAHPDVRCGEETRIVPRMLGMRRNWSVGKEAQRLEEAKITKEVLDEALQSFILEVIVHHGPAAKRLCNKDPFTLRDANYLISLFPRAKFVMMLRDGRGNVASIMERNVTITGYQLNNPESCLRKYSESLLNMLIECNTAGSRHCYVQRYESLVLQPEEELRKLLSWLELPWNDAVMHHEEHIGKDISLSKMEKSTSQVKEKVNTDALSRWTKNKKFNQDLNNRMPEICPVLEATGYDPHGWPPDYSKLTNADIDWGKIQEIYATMKDKKQSRVRPPMPPRF